MQLPRKLIRDRAYFIAGSSSAHRKPNDPHVESAISDAESYLLGLPEDFSAPLVTGATSGSQDEVVVLTWLLQPTKNQFEVVEVAFFGNGWCRVQVPGEHAEPSLKHLQVDELPSLGLDDIVNHLQAGPSSQGPRFQ